MPQWSQVAVARFTRGRRVAEISDSAIELLRAAIARAGEKKVGEDLDRFGPLKPEVFLLAEVATRIDDLRDQLRELQIAIVDRSRG